MVLSAFPWSTVARIINAPRANFDTEHAQILMQ
jgi:hypothetical protein